LIFAETSDTMLNINRSIMSKQQNVVKTSSTENLNSSHENTSGEEDSLEFKFSKCNSIRNGSQ